MGERGERYYFLLGEGTGGIDPNRARALHALIHSNSLDKLQILQTELQNNLQILQTAAVPVRSDVIVCYALVEMKELHSTSRCD